MCERNVTSSIERAVHAGGEPCGIEHGASAVGDQHAQVSITALGEASEAAGLA